MKHTFPGALIMVAILFARPVHGQDTLKRPELAFREDWKEIPAEVPLSQRHVNNPDLMLALYGTGRDSLKKSHHDEPYDDPFYVWSGLCADTWAVSLSHSRFNINLSKQGKVVWRSKQSGVRSLHLLLKTTDGTWLVSKEGDPPSADWRMREFILEDLTWFSMDMEKITELDSVKQPDLSEIEAIGFTDLMKGGGSEACSRLDLIAVYGYLVERNDR